LNLTAGQQRQLDRNQERLAALQEDVREQQEALWKKLYPDVSSGGAKQRSSHENFHEEDEVEDRTRHQSSILDEDGETEQSLALKFKAQYEQLARVRESHQQAENRASQLQKRAMLLEAAGDEDAFFARNEVDLAREKVQKLEAEEDKIGTALRELERLLRVANPKLSVDRKTGYIGIGPPPAPTPAELSSSSDRESEASFPPRTAAAATVPAFSAGQNDGFFVMPAPRPPSVETRTSETVSGPPISEQVDDSKSSMSSSVDLLPPPAPKRKRVLGPTLPPPSGSCADKSQSEASPESKRKFLLPPTARGTLSMLAATSSTSMQDSITGTHSSSTRRNGQVSVGSDQGDGSHGNTNANKISKPMKTSMETAVDPREDKWHAPRDQDGSGRTKLNEKFAGRY